MLIRTMVENARLIMAAPAFSDRSVRDGDLTWTVLGGLAGTAIVGQLVSSVVSGWAAAGLAVLLSPVPFALAWVFGGPRRLLLDEDRLIHVTRVRRSDIALSDLGSLERPRGRRKTALSFWDRSETESIHLWDHSESTEPFRRHVGQRLRELGVPGLKVDPHAAELVFGEGA